MIPGFEGRLAPGGIPVVRIHYTADPAKRPGTPVGDAWIRETVAGYPGGQRSARWQKEMEIRYNALSGAPLFPEWEMWMAQGQIVIEPFDPTGYALYASYDHGWNNPACYHVHGINGDGEIVTLWEFYADRVPMTYIAKIILGDAVILPTRDPDARIQPGERRFAGNPFAKQERWRVADPSMWAQDRPMQDEPNKSTADLFLRAGVHFLEGQRGGDITVAEWLLSYYWQDPQHPRYRITTACPWLLKELGGQRYKTQSAQVAQHTNPSEQLVDKNNHAWDSLKMFLQRFPPAMARPPATKHPGTFEWWRKLAKDPQRPATYRREMAG